MEVVKKSLVVTAVLVVGLGLALLFGRRIDDRPDTDPQGLGVLFNAGQGTRLEDHANGRQGVPRRGQVNRHADRDPEDGVRSPKESPTAIVPGFAPPELEPLREPPQLPTTFDRRIAPPLPRLSNFDDEPFSDDRLPSKADTSPPTGSPSGLDSQTEVSKPQKHTIVNGDTLSRIARRYLGDSDRASEIYDLNRDVLRDADVLPLGRVIAIPPKNRATPAIEDPAVAPMPATDATKQETSEPAPDRPAPKLVPLP